MKEKKTNQEISGGIQLGPKREASRVDDFADFPMFTKFEGTGQTNSQTAAKQQTNSAPAAAHSMKQTEQELRAKNTGKGGQRGRGRKPAAALQDKPMVADAGLNDPAAKTLQTENKPAPMKENQNGQPARTGGQRGRRPQKPRQQANATKQTAQAAQAPQNKQNNRQTTGAQLPQTVQTAQAAQAPTKTVAPGSAAARQTQPRTADHAAPRSHRGRPAGQQGKNAKRSPLRIIPLGGLGEIGKNLTVYEYENDMFLVDCGLAFPDETMLGVDIVLPDFTYLVENKDRLRGIVITHGHEDHIGGLAYLLKEVSIPVYATKLTIGLIEGKLKEHGLTGKVKLNVVKARDHVKMGCMDVEFVRVNHSIPDAVAIVTKTPVGTIVQTGDFKIDYTPIEGQPIDLARFGELGDEGVLMLLSDSTNAERPGCTPTEQKVGASFDNLFKTAGDKRIIVASFSSNVHRIQLVCDAALKYGRKVAVFGRSMENMVNVAFELGYLKIPDNLIIGVEDLRRYKPNQIVLITTGSQGEPMAALSRMSTGDHRQISVGKGDFIIISANPIPGNEKLVGHVINDLLRLGADVIYESMYEVHVSGHACQEELKLMMSLCRPKFFMPVHGEFKHLKRHAELAKSLGIPEANIIIDDNGHVVETDGNTIKLGEMVTAGRVLVDGLGVGDVGSVVLRDRKHLAEDGLVIIAASMDSQTGELLSGPDIVSRGFVYMRDSEELIEQFRAITKEVLNESYGRPVMDWNGVKMQIKDRVGTLVFQKFKRSPMILPIIMEV